MADASTGLTTDRECRVFCRYLASQTPNAYVLGKYADGHRSIICRTQGPARPIDRLLLKLAVAHPMATRVTDAYARVFTPRGVLRHKLVLLLAILESCAPTHKVFDGPHRKGGVSLAFGFAGAATGFSIAFALACVVLLPIHAVLSISSRRRPTASGTLAGADHS